MVEVLCNVDRWVAEEVLEQPLDFVLSLHVVLELLIYCNFPSPCPQGIIFIWMTSQFFLIIVSVKNILKVCVGINKILIVYFVFLKLFVLPF